VAIWLGKTEPAAYSVADLERDGETGWGGVRNPLALKHLRAMRPGDLMLIYHTGSERAIVGLSEIVRAAHGGPQGTPVVDIAFRSRFTRPVTLAEVKAQPALAGWELVRIARLSQMPVPPEAWDFVARQAGLA
jgi:predicted RNA-binding protein with PUA-like domain